MIKIIMFHSSDGLDLPVFLGDTDTQYYGKDVLRTPGVYEEETGERFDLAITSLQGTIGTYATTGMFLLFDPKNDFADIPIEDVTNRLKQYLTVPETAAKMLLRQEDEDAQAETEKMLETLKYYEGLTTNSKVFLPEESFKYMPEDAAKNMRSTRRVYILSNSDNMEIIQENCTANYGVVLSDVETIHAGSDCQPAALDLLRVIAPYRREVSKGVFQYSGIYHTPYFKVDARLRGAVPSYLDFINGYTKNDTLGIQPNERHMYDNLYTLVCADVARYTSQIMSGIMFQSHFGQKLRKVSECRDEETLQRLATDISGSCPDGVTSTFTFSELQTMFASNWNKSDVVSLLKKTITFTRQALDDMLDELPINCQIIDTEHLPFLVEIEDADAEYFTDKLIKRGVLSRPMSEYIIKLCKAAYQTNWGHTGAATAIQRFVTLPAIKVMEGVIAAHLASSLAKVPVDPSINMSLMYSTQSVVEEDEDEDSMESEENSEDRIFARFNYYIASSTAQRISNGVLPSDYFTTKATGAESTEESIVEYWRKVNGEDGLYYFLTGAYMLTGDPKVFIESFLKIMRWGSVKPAMLVLENYPVVKTVFDLNNGLTVKNTAVVDESQLVLVNGCKHTITGFLFSSDVVEVDKKTLVGLALNKDYGDIQKLVLASGVDIGEMVKNGKIDIAELKGVQSFELDAMRMDISELGNLPYDLYTSERNIQAGIKFNIRPNTLSELALITTPGIFQSVEYLKAKHAQMVVTTKDRQYQILNAYSQALKSIDSTYAGTFISGGVMSTDITAWAEAAYDAFNNAMQGQAPDANSLRASQAVSSMNLSLSSAPSLKYDTSPLEGKFAIISDKDLLSSLPNIEFSNSSLRDVANHSSIRNRIVLLMLEVDGKLIFCRKDLVPQEVLLVKGNIAHKSYANVEKVFKALQAGKQPPLTNPFTGNKVRAVLHESVKEFI